MDVIESPDVQNRFLPVILKPVSRIYKVSKTTGIWFTIFLTLGRLNKSIGLATP